MGLGTEVVQDISMLAHWVEIFAMSRQCLSQVITIVIAEGKASSASPTSSGAAETGCRQLGGWVLGRGIALLSETIVSMPPRVSRPIHGYLDPPLGPQDRGVPRMCQRCTWREVVHHQPSSNKDGAM